MKEVGRKLDVYLSKGTYGALGYRSATIANREGRISTAASGEAHARYHRLPLQNQSREFKRDNPIYDGMIARATGYIIGNGFSLQAKTGVTNLNNTIEKRWKNFWKRPEIRGILSGPECEETTCKELLTVGDTGVLKTNIRKIQLIESEQITGKKGYADDGIEKNSLGVPTGFFVGGYNKNGFIDKRTITRYSPEDFLFLTKPDRPSSIRGVPPCQASFPMLHRINDVCDSEAIAWQLLARLAVSVTRQQGKNIAFLESKTDPNKKTDANELTTRLTELDYALIFHGEVGDEIKGIERNLPGKNFSESLIMFLRLLGLPLGLPLEVILLDWTKSNYSQSRAVLEQAFVTFMKWQFKIADFFLTPVFEWWLAGEIGEGEGLKETDTIYEHDWIKPTFPWIDQLKEAQAWGEKLDRGLTLHQKALKSLGADREDEMNEREKEIKDAIERAQRLKKETGIEVPWQHFAGLTPPGQAKAPATGVNEPPTGNQKGQNTGESGE
ncbi:MAG: phage portal protein [Sedimentisphaerales bacterium]